MGKWDSNKVEELKRLYKENDVTSDQLVKDKTAIEDFASRFNSIIGSSDGFSSKEVADKLFQLRKSGKLPRIRK